ncbi:MAG: hypothetical protein M1837_002145 [Sclerophora amabilis]|nr:MAG: hypothetical protein M1837_002145 [Sclerophora amabilis]
MFLVSSLLAKALRIPGDILDLLRSSVLDPRRPRGSYLEPYVQPLVIGEDNYRKAKVDDHSKRASFVPPHARQQGISRRWRGVKIPRQLSTAYPYRERSRQPSRYFESLECADSVEEADRHQKSVYKVWAQDFELPVIQRRLNSPSTRDTLCVLYQTVTLMYLPTKVLVPVIILVTLVTGLVCYLATVIYIRHRWGSRGHPQAEDYERHSAPFKKYVASSPPWKSTASRSSEQRGAPSWTSSLTKVERSESGTPFGSPSTFAQSPLCQCRPFEKPQQERKPPTLGLAMFINHPPESLKGTSPAHKRSSFSFPRRPLPVRISDEHKCTKNLLSHHSRSTVRSSADRHANLQPQYELKAITPSSPRKKPRRSISNPRAKHRNTGPSAADFGLRESHSAESISKRRKDSEHSLPPLPIQRSDSRQRIYNSVTSNSKDLPGLHLSNKSLPPSPSTSRCVTPIAPPQHYQEFPSCSLADTLHSHTEVPHFSFLSSSSDSSNFSPSVAPTPLRVSHGHRRQFQPSPRSSQATIGSTKTYSSVYSTVQGVPVLPGGSRPVPNRRTEDSLPLLPALDKRVMDSQSGTRLKLQTS